MALKIAPLLEQYLITHNRLELPGIGIFIANESGNPEQKTHKQDKEAGMENVTFESNASIKENPDLVQFIAENTGKLKALASADLNSHLALAQQFLNIGNPFLFEGIGVLEKIKSGEYALKPGVGLQEKIKNYSLRERADSPDSAETLSDYKKIFYSDKGKKKWRKSFIILLILSGLTLAIWGGYTVYKMTTSKNKSNSENKEKSVPIKDTPIHQKDSVVAQAQYIPAGMQKFILEVCDSNRAFQRYNQLKSYQWNVQLETKDSITYKIFMLLPAMASDTSRIIDSLSMQTGRKIFIEK